MYLTRVQPHVTPTWFHGASSVIVQHDTHKAPKPRLCACAATAVSCCSGSLAHPRAFAAPSSLLRPYGAFVAPVFVGYHDAVAMLPVFLSQGFFFAGNDGMFPGHVSQEDGTAVVWVFGYRGDIVSYVSECGDCQGTVKHCSTSASG